MPTDMDPEAQPYWKHVMREMGDSGVILGVDRDMLRVYCEAAASYARYNTMLLRSGSLIRGARGRELVVNPLIRLRREERDAMRLLSRELGLSPAARAGLRVDMGSAMFDMDAVIGPPPRLRVIGE
jgi:P27 family predicted phage terminase small subunit